MERKPNSKLPDHYDRIYGEDRSAFGGGEPMRTVLEAADLLPQGGHVVEYGAGQGRNALKLAERGFIVRAVDLSPVGVSAMKENATKNGLTTFSAEYPY